MFRTVFPSIIKSLRLYIQHQVSVIQVLWQLQQKRDGTRESSTSKGNKSTFVYTEIHAIVQAPLMDTVNVGF
jgi:hypothetical protein